MLVISYPFISNLGSAPHSTINSLFFSFSIEGGIDNDNFDILPFDHCTPRALGPQFKSHRINFQFSMVVVNYGFICTPTSAYNLKVSTSATISMALSRDIFLTSLFLFFFTLLFILPVSATIRDIDSVPLLPSSLFFRSLHSLPSFSPSSLPRVIFQRPAKLLHSAFHILFKSGGIY